VRPAVEADGLADDIAVCTKSLAPQRGAQNRDSRSLGAVFLRCKGAAEERLDTEHLREVAGDLESPDPIGARGIRDVEAARVVIGDRVEQLLILVPAIEVGMVDADDVEIPFRRGGVDVGEPLGMREREGPEKEAVDEAEDGNVRGNPEREHRDDERGRAALAQQRAPGVAQIGTSHEGRPFVDVDREGDAVRRPSVETRAEEVRDRARPDEGGCDPSARARLGEALREELGHVVAVRIAKPTRSEPEQQTVGAIHRACPVRMRARASRARRPRRSASSVSAARPVLVSR
jgi:hypothetical protein